jgi:hypothetical protein
MKPLSPTPRLPHTQIHLPPLSADYALTLVNILERAITAIWRAHGDAMADLQAVRGIETPMPPDAVLVRSTRPEDPDPEF